MRLAAERRGRPLPGKANRVKWDRAVAAYVKSGGGGNKPFRKTTSDTVEYACKAFRDWTGVTSPEEVTSGLLQAFYDVHSGRRKPTKEEKKPNFINVATAQGYTSKLGTFLRRGGVHVDYSFKGDSPLVRDVVVAPKDVTTLINDCPRLDLKFVLFAGFHAGLRKEEITMARPQWFRLDLGHIAVPALQEVDGRFWEVKSRRPRKVPLTPEFRKFLENDFGDWRNQNYMLHPSAKGKRYRWDFRRPWEDYLTSKGLWKKDGEDNVTPHSMRHSYITHLADAKYSAAQIAAWSGDRIRTIETNYLHTAAPEGSVDSLYSGKKALSLEEIAESIQGLKGQIGQGTADAIDKLLKEAELKNEVRWEWTDSAPDIHVQLHSVADTINDREIFGSLFPMPDTGDSTVTAKDWEEGFVSTPRARLMLLEKHGWIKKLNAKDIPTLPSVSSTATLGIG